MSKLCRKCTTGNTQLDELKSSVRRALEFDNYKETLRLSSRMLELDISVQYGYKVKAYSLMKLDKTLDALVVIEEGLQYHPDDDELLDYNHSYKVEIASDDLSEKLQNNDRTILYCMDFTPQSLLLFKGLEFFKDFKTTEIPSEEEWDYPIWRDFMEVALDCKMPKLTPARNISEQMEPFYRKYDAMIEKAVGDEYFNEKRYKLAIKKYEAAIKHTIDNIMTMTLHKKIAECYSKLEVKDNHNCFNFGDELGKLDMSTLVNCAEHALKAENFKEALRISSEMLKRNSLFEKAYKIKGIALKNLNKEKANAEKAIGNKYFREKKFKLAIEKYEDIIEKYGSDITLFNNIATCYFKLGQEDSHNFVISREMSVKALGAARPVKNFASKIVNKPHKIINKPHSSERSCFPSSKADPRDISKAMARIGLCFESENEVEKAIKWLWKSVAEFPDKNISMRIEKLLEKRIRIQKVRKRNSRVG